MEQEAFCRLLPGYVRGFVVRAAVPESGQPGPEDAVTLLQGGAFDGPLEDGRLLAQGQIFHGQGGPAGEQGPQQDADLFYHAHGEAVLSGCKGSERVKKLPPGRKTPI
jgi:hypothetical protein